MESQECFFFADEDVLKVKRHKEKHSKQKTLDASEVTDNKPVPGLHLINVWIKYSFCNGIILESPVILTYEFIDNYELITFPSCFIIHEVSSGFIICMHT